MQYIVDDFIIDANAMRAVNVRNDSASVQTVPLYRDKMTLAGVQRCILYVYRTKRHQCWFKMPSTYGDKMLLLSAQVQYVRLPDKTTSGTFPTVRLQNVRLPDKMHFITLMVKCIWDNRKLKFLHVPLR